MTKKLFLNSLSGTTLYVVNAIVAFIVSPILIKALGNRDYGLWELVMSVIGYMGLLDLGIGPALVRFVSVADGSQDRDDLQNTISTAFAFFSAVGVVAVLIFLALGIYPSLIVGKEAKNIANLSTVFFLLGVNAAMLFPLQVFTATLMGVQRHYFINNSRVFLAIVRAFLICFLIQQYQGRGLIILALLEPVFTLIQYLLFAGVIHFDKNMPKIFLSAITWPKAKEMSTFGAKSVFMLVASRLQNQSVPLIISSVLGLSQIVYFVMPNRLVDYAKGVSLAVGFPLTPYFGAAIGRGAHDELVDSWLNTTLALQIISLPMPVIIFFFGETFLSLWIGQEYAVAGRVVLYVLLVGLVADSLATNAFRMLTAKGKHGVCAMVWLVLSAISIPLGIWGARLWGVVGVAVGTTFVTVIANLVTVFMACALMQVSVSTYLRKTLLRILLPLTILVIVIWGITHLVLARCYLDLLLHLIVSGSIYLLAVWQFTIGTDVRERLIEIVKARFAT